MGKKVKVGFMQLHLGLLIMFGVFADYGENFAKIKNY